MYTWPATLLGKKAALTGNSVRPPQAHTKAPRLRRTSDSGPLKVRTMTTKAFAAAEDGPNAAGEERHLLSEMDATALAALRIKVAPF